MGEAVILVEGESDRVALEAVAVRLARDLEAEGTSIVAMDGATNLGRFLGRDGPIEHPIVRGGLYDVAEEPYVRGALERTGLGPTGSREDLERLGFFACVVDLEDELIRALGADGVLEVVRGRGELGPFRTLPANPSGAGNPSSGSSGGSSGTLAGRSSTHRSSSKPSTPWRSRDRSSPCSVTRDRMGPGDAAYGGWMTERARPVVVHPNGPMPEPPGAERRHFHDADGRWIGWAGWIRNEAGDVSGWHHHAANETHVYVIRGSVTVEFGPGGTERIVAGAGGYFIVPADTVHRELTGDGSDLEAYIVRVGGEPEEAAADGPEPLEA